MEKERNSRPSKKPRKKVCLFCADRIEKIDYKDLAKLRKCMTEELRSFPDVLQVPVHIISVS